MNFFLIAYDIPDDKRRNRAADILQDYGQRVQYSVFEVWLSAAHEAELRARLEEVIVEAEDSVRLYQLCANCQTKVICLGTGGTPKPPAAIIL